MSSAKRSHLFRLNMLKQSGECRQLQPVDTVHKKNQIRCEKCTGRRLIIFGVSNLVIVWCTGTTVNKSRPEQKWPPFLQKSYSNSFSDMEDVIEFKLTRPSRITISLLQGWYLMETYRLHILQHTVFTYHKIGIYVLKDRLSQRLIQRKLDHHIVVCYQCKHET